MLSRCAFLGAFFLLLLGAVSSSALAVSALKASLTFPHLSFTSHATGPQTSILLAKHIHRGASSPIATPSLLRSWLDGAHAHPGNRVSFHYVVANASNRAVQVSLTASLASSLSLGTSGTPSGASVGRVVLLPPGRSTRAGTLAVPAGLHPGRYYLSLNLVDGDTGGGQALVDGAVTLQVSR